MNSQEAGKKPLAAIQYPLSFMSQTVAMSGTEGTWDTTSQHFKSTCCVPEEFHGSGGGLSPEDLFNHALTNCFVATFKVYAENSHLNFQEILVTSKLTVDCNETKKPVMKSISIDVKITNPSSAEKALLLAKKASESGFILNSVKTERLFSYEIITNEKSGTL